MQVQANAGVMIRALAEDAAKVASAPAGTAATARAVTLASWTPNEAASLATSVGELFSQQNDGYCVERATLGAMLAAQRSSGGIAGLASAGRDDALAAGIATARGVNLRGTRMNLHAALAIQVAGEDEPRVLDHVVAGTDDGTLPLSRWTRNLSARDDDVTVSSPMSLPARNAHSHAGIPPAPPVQWSPEEITAMADRVASRAELG